MAAVTTEDTTGSAGSEAGDHRPGRFRRWLTALIAVAAICLAVFLLYRTLGRYDFDEVVDSVRAVSGTRLLLAGFFAAASYLCLTGFDWLALHYAGRPQPYHRAALASFTSLSIGHNIGFAALSSGTLRYRFYSRWGLTAGEVAKVILFCGVTVGLGLAILGGAALLLRPDAAENILRLDRAMIFLLAAACIVGPMMYVALAAVLRRRLTIKGWSIEMPSLRLAIGQVIIGPLNFAMVAACLHQTISAIAEVPYFAVASVYVIANVAALITHVPGGLGVIESVVLFLLSQAGLIGAVLVFRVVYFLVPLALGVTLLGLSELILRNVKAPTCRSNEATEAREIC